MPDIDPYVDNYEMRVCDWDFSQDQDFAELAQKTADRAPDSQETTVALRKLLEAKDAAVRAVLPAR